MRDGRVVKGVKFVNIRDAGDPVECAEAYCRAGADELAMLDITATIEGRGAMLQTISRVARAVTIPLTVGGGIGDVKSAAAVLQAGASRVSTSSAAFRRPAVIAEMLREFGSKKVTVAIDVDRNPAMSSGYEVFIDGGRTATGADALEWAKQAAGMGATSLLPTSKATDGERTGYDLPLIRMFAQATNAEITASGGAGRLEHFLEAALAGAGVLLAASVFHFGVIAIPELKTFLRDHGVPIMGNGDAHAQAKPS